MAKQVKQESEIISFIRKRDYRFVKELGSGACGRTVLLHDDVIDEYVVCKKYAPYSEGERSALFNNFVREIKLLHLLSHDNLVRIFNYYLYPDALSGFILMEYINGQDIESHVKACPEQLSDLFLQAVSAFSYLERSGILHRDVRPGNLLVDATGRLKVIDFGFGKRIEESADYDKSVTLNWWCDPPADFKVGKYDFCTEVYFVGRLFERLVTDVDADQFAYKSALAGMCHYERSDRIAGFSEIQKTLEAGKLLDVGLSDEAIDTYRAFAKALSWHFRNIESGAKYIDDADRVEKQLNDVYRRCMLEETVPDASAVLNCFVSGTYDLHP
jgi:serine/threonine protein kinase